MLIPLRPLWRRCRAAIIRTPRRRLTRKAGFNHSLLLPAGRNLAEDGRRPKYQGSSTRPIPGAAIDVADKSYTAPENPLHPRLHSGRETNLQTRLLRI